MSACSSRSDKNNYFDTPVLIKDLFPNIEHYGNTTAATLPLLLNDYETKFTIGDKLVFTAFGAGFTWGAAHLTWAY